MRRTAGPRGEMEGPRPRWDPPGSAALPVHGRPSRTCPAVSQEPLVNESRHLEVTATERSCFCVWELGRVIQNCPPASQGCRWRLRQSPES